MAGSKGAVDLVRVAGKKILFAMAAHQEYGEHLRRRFSPLLTGVGPVEAGVALGAALAALEIAGRQADLVVSLGSAGSRALEQTRVYRASSVSYRDMDASAVGFEKGVTPFLDLPPALPLDLAVPGVPDATLSTGANVVSGAAYERIDAQMVDMETFAVLRACQRFGVPLVALRGISDGKAELTHVADWTEYLHVVDENLAAAVDLLFQGLEKGTIRL